MGNGRRLYLAEPTGMDQAAVQALYQAFAGDRLTFLYSGKFHDEHTARLITLGEEYLEREGSDKSVKSKLGFIMVEAYQNIVRHRTAVNGSTQGEGRSMFLLRSTATQHEVTAMNAVAETTVEPLTASVEKLRALDLQQMKQVFLRGLQSEERTERGGAGLGLIEMARRSGHPLRYGFAAIDSAFRLFALQVLVGKGGAWRGDVGEAFKLHKAVVENDIAVLGRGRSAAGEQEAILRIIERDMEDDRSRSDVRTRAYLAISELLENLGTAGEGPMIIFRHTAGRTALVVGTPLSEAAMSRLSAAVGSVMALDAQGLQRRYRDILLGRVEASDTMQLGLIELARSSSAPLKVTQAPSGSGPFAVLEAVI